MQNQSTIGDEFRRVRTKIEGIMNNLIKANDVPERTAIEYHSLLDRLVLIGINVNEYRIRDAELSSREEGPIIVKGTQGVEPRPLSKRRYVNYNIFMTRIESLYRYLQSGIDIPKNPIGFESKE